MGSVSAGFEKVQEVFERGASDFGVGGGAFCAYAGGRKVVDLWGGFKKPGVRWSEETAAVIMSSTKGMTALCAQILFDRGLLDIDERVSFYWPEFAANGKDAITVRHVLSHTCGVVGVPGHETEFGLDGTGAWDDYDAIASWLAEAPPAWEPGSKVGYHAISYGWLVGELVRRIDGRTLGTFFKDEVAVPLGLDARIGTPAAEQGRVASVHQDDLETRQRAADATLAQLPDAMREHITALFAAYRDPATPAGQAFLAHGNGVMVLDTLPELLNGERGRAAEIGASNGTSTARDLARMYAMLANGGELDGARVVSEKAVEVFGTEQVQGIDAILGFPCRWALGYWANLAPAGQPPRFGPSDAAFGHPGAGGQLGFADPENNVAVGFVRSHLSVDPAFSTSLVRTLYDCLA